jgi:hypothetical protein
MPSGGGHVIKAGVGAAADLYDKWPRRQRDEAVRSATFSGAPLKIAAKTMDLGSGPVIGIYAVAVPENIASAETEIPALPSAVSTALTDKCGQKPWWPISDVLSLI